MSRLRPLLLLLLLPACQSLHPRQSAATPPENTFYQDTAQTYDIQTGQFQQRPPYGARSMGSQ